MFRLRRKFVSFKAWKPDIPFNYQYLLMLFRQAWSSSVDFRVSAASDLKQWPPEITLLAKFQPNRRGWGKSDFFNFQKIYILIFWKKYQENRKQNVIYMQIYFLPLNCVLPIKKVDLHLHFLRNFPLYLLNPYIFDLKNSLILLSKTSPNTSQML